MILAVIEILAGVGLISLGIWIYRHRNDGSSMKDFTHFED
jgi:hypothetical protein